VDVDWLDGLAAAIVRLRLPTFDVKVRIPEQVAFDTINTFTMLAQRLGLQTARRRTPP
jgi:hypothetical protein